MNFKIVAGWAVVAFVVWWTIQHPASASHVVHNIGTFIMTVTNGISHFFTSI